MTEAPPDPPPFLRGSPPVKPGGGEGGHALPPNLPYGGRCAVAILPSEGGDKDRLASSIKKAEAFGAGDLTELELLSLAGSGDARAALAEAAALALENGSDWLLAVSAAETLVPHCFVKIAPALRVYDAVWGGAGLMTRPDGGLHPSLSPSPSPQGGGEESRVEQITRLAAQDLPTFFHAALRWWIGPTHFVRPGAVVAALSAASGPAWRAEYMMALWRGSRAYKTAQALTLFHAPLPQLPAADRDRLVDALEQEPVFAPIRYGGRTLSVPYTGLNPVIEREQMRGLFFEQDELTALAERLPRRMRIVDVGANTGNHTLFFAAVMDAETVIPIEPQPRAAAAIRIAVAENGMSNVDLSRLGVAVGASSGRLTALPATRAGLGATQFSDDPQGMTRQARLDDLVSGPADFIKIDVEGMEMAVLAGAAALIERCRPALFIEALDANAAELTAWADAHRYRFERLFPDKTHCNYLLVPAE